MTVNWHDFAALARIDCIPRDYWVSTHRLAQRSRRYLRACGELWRLDVST